MKWTMNRIALIGIVLLAVVLSCSTAFAQNKTVKASLDFQMYDVVYLTDFVDIKNQQLNPNISGISLSMSVIMLIMCSCCNGRHIGRVVSRHGVRVFVVLPGIYSCLRRARAAC